METLSRPAFWIPLAALVAGVVAALLVRLVLLSAGTRTGSNVAASLARHTTAPLLLLLPVFLARLVQPLLRLEPAVIPALRHAGTLLLILAFGWLLLSVVAVLDESMRERALAGVHDETRANRVLTRVGIFRRVLNTLIIVIAFAGMMATFEAGRAIGASILASAGIAALVLGIAARPAAESLIAGLRVALTEPIHIDDVVIVEGEWGKIEEITSAYVVVRIWDRRRLIVPLSYFLDRPFQNWTRAGTDLLAQVSLEVDYSTPVGEVRDQAGRIVTASTLWDGEFWNLQVTEAGERTMRLRVLASAANADHAWDLRCEIREKLIAYLQECHPKALPKVRAVLEGGAPAAGAAPPPV
jgi:small-conductance mechanosensitive channel